MTRSAAVRCRSENPMNATRTLTHLAAAAALTLSTAAAQAQAPERAVHWAHALQAAFYGHGLSLSDPGTIAGIADANGLDASAVLRDLREGPAERQAHRDFAMAGQLGAVSYPTLLFVDGAEVHPLPATGTPLDVLNHRLGVLLA
ncbi:DsbA family protein [Acidovorax sp. NCPPB 4044]|nr:DsbA family protein [Acidovorax sp. NCPPB 4044]MDA8519191.1 DsbA family protein [Acidovorax sp. NCPPB 4044]